MSNRQIIIEAMAEEAKQELHQMCEQAQERINRSLGQSLRHSLARIERVRRECIGRMEDNKVDEPRPTEQT